MTQRDKPCQLRRGTRTALYSIQQGNSEIQQSRVLSRLLTELKQVQVDGTTTASTPCASNYVAS